MTLESLQLRASSAWILAKFNKYGWAYDRSVRKSIRGLGKIQTQDYWQWRHWIEHTWTDLLLTRFRGGACTALIFRLSSKFLWFTACWFVEWKNRVVSGWIERRLNYMYIIMQVLYSIPLYIDLIRNAEVRLRAVHLRGGEETDW